MSSPRPIARLTLADLDAVRAILEPSKLHVELEAELEREIALPWVVRAEGGSVAGFLLAWSVADELHLLELAVSLEQRRKGFARALLEHLLEHARAEKKRLLLLEVRRSNGAAIKLYESIGFSTTGVRRGYYSDTNEDALEMRITFDPTSGAIVPESD
ncbi:MAG TPA: ribosomal protein S18-alanine N-acetyltransferase [Polyangiaceae bacterium]|jgi:ribosomal-protein-alanine N-acetyltransferase|nr:ribosomal protein S18-alanine N-acetyltransferase [Polyangiaceae bacterium]